MTGGAVTVLSLHDLSGIVGRSSGFIAAAVVDSERGPIDQTLKVTTNTLHKFFGKANSKKYGTSLLSVQAALQNSTMYVRRVDKGQTYATALVRGKLEANVFVDKYGNWINRPKASTVIAGGTQLAHNAINSYVFNQYPVDYITDAETTYTIISGDRISNSLVTSNPGELTAGDRIATATDDDLNEGIGEVFTVKSVTSETYQNFFLRLNKVDAATIEQIKASAATGYLLHQINPAAVTPPASKCVTVVSYDQSTLILKVEADEQPTGNLTLKDEVLEIATATQDGEGNWDLTFTTEPTTDPIEITVGLICKLDDITDPVSNEPTYYSFIPKVTFEFHEGDNYDAANKGLVIRVSTADPIKVGDLIGLSLNETDTTAVIKDLEVADIYQTQAKRYRINVNEPINDTEGFYDNKVLYKVLRNNFEHRDCFLVYAIYPGDYGNKLSIKISDSAYDPDNFVITVYEDGKKLQGEEFECCMSYKLDGYGRQLFVEQVINNRSGAIRVIANPDMIDVEGKPIRPLNTDSYLRQPLPTTNYSEVGKTTELIFDGDSYITLDEESIQNIDLDKPLRLAGKDYDIINVSRRSDGGPIDTIIVKGIISLDMDYLQLSDRKLDVGTPVYQSIAKLHTLKITDTLGDVDTTYTITINSNEFVIEGTTAAIRTANLKTAIDSLETLDFRAKTTDEENVLVVVSKTEGGTINAKSKDAGVTVETTQEPVTSQQTYPVEKVSGSVLPTADAGATITLDGKQYYIVDAGTNRFKGGYDSNYPTVGQYINTLKKAFGNYTDSPDLICLMQAGINSPEYIAAMNEICESRLDCIYVSSVSFDAQAGIGVAGEIKYRQDLNINSRCGAIYSPWLSYYDADNDLNVWLAPDAYVVSTLARSKRQGTEYMAPAGWKRGVINGSRAYKVYDYSGDTGGEIGQLYDAQINPIRSDATKGLAIWGQKTMQTTPSATDRLNTNLVAIAIMKQLRDYLENQTFDFNDAPTRATHQSQMENVMHYYLDRGAIEGFEVRCNDVNNPQEVIENHELYIDVHFWGKYSSERQYGRLVITSDGSASINSLSI